MGEYAVVWWRFVVGDDGDGSFAVVLARLDPARLEDDWVRTGFKPLGEERAAVPGHHRPIPPADQMQLLPLSQQIPGSGKIEIGSRDLLQPQHPLIKLATRLHILHMQRDVIQFREFHAPKIRLCTCNDSIGHATS